jgi:hypothetical protein
MLRRPEPPDALSLTEQHRNTLKSLTIDATTPGPLLHDMAALLDRLADEPLRLTATQRLSRKDLPVLNDMLQHPLNIDLKRPQQKSYPPLLGLYLLLRASGLTRVDESGRENYLKLSDAIYEQWQRLNPTERYGHLLESWLLRGDSAILGEFSPRYRELPDNFPHAAEFMLNIPDEGKQIAGDKEAERTLYLMPEWHNLGLMMEFGWIQVESGQPDPGSGWKIERVERTDAGDAMLSALYTDLFSDFDRLFELRDSDGDFTGVLQEVMQPYLSDWQTAIRLPSAEFVGGMYTFRVSLGKVWRRIEVAGEHILDELAWAILEAFEFDVDHLYEFVYQDAFGRESSVHHSYMDDYPFTSEVRIGDLPLGIGQTMTFVFDFGDNWQFKLVLENIDPGREMDETQVIEKHGDPPQQYRSW